MTLWRRIFLLLLMGGLVSATLTPPLANGATVQLVPRVSATNPGVTFKVIYGYLNITNTQLYAKIPGVYANGTIYFDMTGQDKNQGTYAYIVKSYGNGTLNLVFRTDAIPNVITAKLSSTASYVNGKNGVVVQYTGNIASDPLIIGFAGKGQLGPLFGSTILGLGAFLSFIPFLSILQWIKGGKVEDKKPFVRMMFVLLLIGVCMAAVGALFIALPPI